METIISTLTSKSQTVIPKAIRTKMGLKAGDKIRYVLRGEKVEIEKLPLPAGDAWENFNPLVTFTEWASTEDDEAFAHLQEAAERAYRRALKVK